MNTTTAAAQKQEADDRGWSYPTSKPTTPFGGGSGSQNDPYLITKAQHLANLSYMVNNGETYKGKYFRMTRDIVLNDNMMSEDGKFNAANASSYTEWKTIGSRSLSWDASYDYEQFCGFFDGDGHTIYGVYQSYTVETEARKWHGFFFRVASAIVSNLTISHSYIYTNARRNQDYRGILCGQAVNSTFSNCHVKNSYIHELSTGSPYTGLGGFLGRGYETEIRDCSFNGTIEVGAYSTLDDMGTGGLVGSINTCKIADCKASGNIIIKTSKGKDGDGQVAAGGIFGFSYANSSVSRCLNTMDIVVHHENSADEMCAIYAGGIGGYVNVQDNDENFFSQCVNMGNIVVGASRETFNMKKRLMMLSGIANLYQSTPILTSGTVNVSDCANYGNIRLEAGSITSNDSDEKLLAAGCCVLYTKVTGTLKTNWKRCINVSDGNSMTAGTLTMRYAPIMGIMDREEEDKQYINVVNPCYYNTNVSNVLNPVSSVSYTDLELFQNKTPFALTADTPSWTYLTDKESTTWVGYAVPYTPFFTKTSLLGSGTETDPYLITNEKELLTLNTFMGNKGDAGYSAYYCLKNDLDMTNMGTFPTIVNGMNNATGFTGTFDGNGHYINGLRVSRDAMFDRIGTGGVVKNLMLTNFRGNEAVSFNTSIAGFNYGTIEDCSVFGTISSRLGSKLDKNIEIKASGIARTVFEGGVIRRCMFKGKLKVSSKTSADEANATGLTARVTGGIACFVEGKVEQSYASFDLVVENSEGFNSYIYNEGIGKTSSNGVIQNCAFVCADVKFAPTGVTKCAFEADITPDKLGDTKSSVWLKGAYRPVNNHTKHLTVTDHNGLETNLDLCPDDAWTYNKVYNLTLTEANADDRLLQQFKNLALYNPQNKTAYIINLELDRDRDRATQRFEYTPVSGCKATKGATRVTIKKDDALADKPGHYLLCLPCPLRTADLPKGSEIHGLGYNAANEENTNQSVFYLTECDSVGAGVPCHVYIPDCVNGDFTLLSYGDIVSAPQGTAKYGPQGYFEQTDVSKAFTGITVKSDNKTPEHLTYTEGPTEMKLFSAAATSEKRTDNQWLRAIKVLDESDPYLAETIKSLHGQTKDNIYLKRKLWGNEWNTLTLPFDVSVESLASYADADMEMEAEELTSITTDANGGIVLNFSKVSELTAGKPYLVRPTASCTGFKFLDITTTINALLTAVPVSNNQYEVTMHPNYAPLVLVAGDYFLQDDQFYVVAEGMTVPSLGMRAHFTANAAASKALQSARLIHADGDVTGIDGITRPAANAAVYDLSGRRVEKPAHGLYIVNGRKVLLP